MRSNAFDNFAENVMDGIEIVNELFIVITTC